MEPRYRSDLPADSELSFHPRAADYNVVILLPATALDASRPVDFRCPVQKTTCFNGASELHIPGFLRRLTPFSRWILFTQITRVLLFFDPVRAAPTEGA